MEALQAGADVALPWQAPAGQNDASSVAGFPTRCELAGLLWSVAIAQHAMAGEKPAAKVESAGCRACPFHALVNCVCAQYSRLSSSAGVPCTIGSIIVQSLSLTYMSDDAILENTLFGQYEGICQVCQSMIALLHSAGCMCQ